MAIGQLHRADAQVNQVIGVQWIRVAEFLAVTPNDNTIVRCAAIPFDCEVVAAAAVTNTDSNDGTTLGVQIQNNATSAAAILTTALNMHLDGSTTPKVARTTDIVAAQAGLDKGEYLYVQLVATGNYGASRNFWVDIAVRAKSPSSGQTIPETAV